MVLEVVLKENFKNTGFKREKVPGNLPFSHDIMWTDKISRDNQKNKISVDSGIILHNNKIVLKL